MKRIVLFIMLLTLLTLNILTSCGKNLLNNSASESSDETPKDTIEYMNIEKSQEYTSVDLTEYTNYYFDGSNGLDSNDGLSEATAKKTITSINNFIKTVTQPTRILLKGGSIFVGTLQIGDFIATENKPLIVGSYGEGYPVIDGNGKLNAVEITDSNIRFLNIKVTNKTGNNGIWAKAKGEGSTKNIVISNCLLDTINWRWYEDRTPLEIFNDKDIGNIDLIRVTPDIKYTRETGGINFVGTYKSWFENVWIENNKFNCVSRNGIFFFSTLKNEDYNYNQNINLVGNDMEFIGGDGIILGKSRNSFIESNKCFYANYLSRVMNGKSQCNAGIWPIMCNNIIMQFNEAAYTLLPPGSGDGEGFDIDANLIDVVFRYNYAHDNEGGGLLICNDGREFNNIEITNNLFVNNGKSSENSAFITLSSDCKGINIENNTVICNPEIMSQKLIVSADWQQTGLQKNLYFKNNLFYCYENTFMTIDMTYVDSYVFDTNLFYNFAESFFDELKREYSEKVELNNFIKDVDPKIVIPENPDGFAKVKEYKVNNSYVFVSGKKLKKTNKYDLGGNSTVGISYLGAFCK